MGLISGKKSGGRIPGNFHPIKSRWPEKKKKSWKYHVKDAGEKGLDVFLSPETKDEPI